MATMKFNYNTHVTFTVELIDVWLAKAPMSDDRFIAKVTADPVYTEHQLQAKTLELLATAIWKHIFGKFGVETTNYPYADDILQELLAQYRDMTTLKEND